MLVLARTGCWAACVLLVASIGSSNAQASLPLFPSALDGLSPTCQKAVEAIQAQLANNQTKGVAITGLTEAAFSSGRVLEGLTLMNLALKAPPPPDQSAQSPLLGLVAGFPFVSLGQPDSCKYIPDYQYCQIDLAGVYIRYGVCVPQGCGAADLALALNQTYHAMSKAATQGKGEGDWLSPLIAIERSTKCGDVAYNYTWGTYVMIVITLVLLAIVAAATAVEWLRRCEESRRKKRDGPRDEAELFLLSYNLDERRWFEANGPGMKVLLCFSLIKNWELFTAKARGGPFDSLDGVRTFSMCWVIFGHTFIFAMLGTSFSNLRNLLGLNGEGLIATYAAQAITGGYFAVDTFFFLSAFLAVYYMLEQLRKGPQSLLSYLGFLLQAPKILLLRFIRLTPTYFYVLLMYWQVMRIASSGPFWGAQKDQDYAVCRQRWWSNLLYINNFVGLNMNGQPSVSCYPVSWYLAVDFQLFLLTPLVAVLAAWNYFFTLALLGLLGTASVAYTWVEAYNQHWSMNLLDQGPYFTSYYIKPWTRAPPYLIGMALAIVWFYHFRGQVQGVLPTRVGKVRRDRVMVAVLGLLSLFLFGATVYGGRGIYADTPSTWSTGEMSAYIALSKPAWAVGLSLMCFLLFLGEGGPIKTLLECRVVTIVSRATYCMYLVHPAVIYWSYDSLIAPVHYSTIWYIMAFMGLLSTVFLISVGVHLVVERPVANLERLARGDKGKKKVPPPFSKAALVLEEAGDGEAKEAMESIDLDMDVDMDMDIATGVEGDLSEPLLAEPEDQR